MVVIVGKEFGIILRSIFLLPNDICYKVFPIEYFITNHFRVMGFCVIKIYPY